MNMSPHPPTLSENRPVFVLGVGAQKGGTTWLSKYLGAQPSVDLGATKEYHIWDTLSVPELSYFDVRGAPLRRSVRRLKEILGLREPALRERMLRDPEVYFDYFAERLAGDGIRLTADITPSYSALPTPVLRRIADSFDRRGIETRAVFLMRDPVERSWSAIRMYFALQNSESAGRQKIDLSLTPEEALLAYLETDQAWLRADYPRTLSTLREVFPPERLFVGCYETFFSSSELARISAFLGIPADPAWLEKRFNVSLDTSSLDPEVRARARARLASVYAHFEHEDRWIGEVWKDLERTPAAAG